MNKSIVVALVVLVAVVAFGGYAYAEGASCCANGTCPLHGFFNSLGGFLYNALPWNWGNWAGK